MPKGILEFDLVEDHDDFIAACKAGQLVMTIQEILNEVFRKRWKYDLSEDEKIMDRKELIEKMRDQCLEIVDANGITELVG